MTQPIPMSQDLLSALCLENILGLMVIDTAGKVIFMNQQCADYIQVDLHSSMGKHVNQVFPPSQMTQLLKGNQRINTDFYFHDGRMSVSTQVQLRHQGVIVGVLEYDTIQELSSFESFLNRYASVLNDELSYYRDQFHHLRRTKYAIDSLVGDSQAMKDLKNQIRLAAMSNSNVLITGETGTGKEIVAHAIHNASRRVAENFIKINAAGIPDSLAESELFGYEEGAFTGAKKSGKKGKFELAHNGTLFIDEINQMPVSLQAKILRVIQEKELERVGGETSISVNVRIIAATNQPLEKLVKQHQFREDLYYRLHVFSITVPPLRDHLEDLPALLEHQVSQLNNEMGKNVNQIDPDVYHYLQGLPWPGNVRELFNRIEKAMNYVAESTLSLRHFVETDGINPVQLPSLRDIHLLQASDNPLEEAKREAEKHLILHTLEQFQGNKTKAAAYLKIHRTQLHHKIKRLGIE